MGCGESSTKVYAEDNGGESGTPTLAETIMQTDSRERKPYVPDRSFRHLRLFWCSWFHDDLTWPSHGTYKCRKCGIVFTVPWRRLDPNLNPPWQTRVNPTPESRCVPNERARLEA